MNLGAELRKEREERGMSLDELSSLTKISVRYLEAVENDKLERLPGQFFIKGIIRSYAKAVGLDPEVMLRKYRGAGLLPDVVVSAAPIDSGMDFEDDGDAPIKRARRAARGVVAVVLLTAMCVGGYLWLGPKIAALRSRSAAAATAKTAAAKKVPRVPASKPAANPAEAGGAPATSPADNPSGAQGAKPSATPPAGTNPGSSPDTTAASGSLSSAPAQSATPNDGSGNPAAAPAGSAPASSVPSPTAPGAGASGAPSAPLSLVVSISAPTWLQVYADGRIALDGVYPAGKRLVAEASRELRIHSGNAGGMSLLLNGRPARSLGASGAVVRDVVITPQTAGQFLQEDGPRRTP